MKAYPRLFGAALLSTMVLAQAVQAQDGPELDPSKVQAGTYAIEPVHTRVLFAVSHLGFSTWYGEFTNASGTLKLAPGFVEGSTFEIRIPVETVSTSNAKLDGELKDAPWLDAAQFPEILFKAKKVERTGDKTAKVTGELTLHGVTKPVTLNVKFNGAGINPLDKKYTVGFEAKGLIKRSDFGVKTYLPLIGDDVTLIISAAFERN